MNKNIKEKLLSNNESKSDDTNASNSNVLSTFNDQKDSSQRQLSEEDVRLGDKPPFKTLAFLSIGPIYSVINNNMDIEST